MDNATNLKTESMPDPSSAKPPADLGRLSPVAGALQRMSIIEEPWLRLTFDGLAPIVTVATTIIVFGKWYSRGVLDLPYLSGGLAIVVSLVVTRELFQKFPRMLGTIWSRKVLVKRIGKDGGRQGSDGDAEELFQKFIEDSEQQLNSRWSVAFGIAGALVAFWLLLLLDGEQIGRTLADLRNDLLAHTVSLGARIVYLVAGFVGGLIAWRVVIIAHRISELGDRFDVDLRIGHPDRCGGLRPIGDVCLLLAYTLSPLLLLLGTWLTLVSFLKPEDLSLAPDSLRYLVPTLEATVIPLTVFSLLGFMRPLLHVHASMLRARWRLRGELELIAQRIHEIGTELLTKADGLSPEEGTELEDKADFLGRVYERNSGIPTWPISFSHVWRLGSIQIAPIVGLASSGLGIVEWLLKILK
jgi:hypothetical protein